MSPFILNTPPELIQEIVLFAVYDSDLGPPSVLHALLLTCRPFYRILSFNSSSSLYADIFQSVFDSTAPARRLGNVWLTPDNVKLELRQRCLALQCFRRGLLDDPQLPDALVVAYLMALEDDGKNSAQLRWARLPSLLQAFIRQRLSGSLENDGWPVENETNSLVVSLAWLLSSFSCDRKTNHPLGAYTFAAFRYPCSNVPEHRFYASSLDDAKVIANSVHGPYPPSRIRPREVIHYGQAIRVQIPPVAVSALLSYFSTKTSLAMSQISIETNAFNTRAEANAVGSHGPTREDVTLVNSGYRMRNVDASQDRSCMLRPSRTHDPDWVRAIQCQDLSHVLSLHLLTAHKPGALTGCWKGTSITPGVYEYTHWLSNIVAPASFDECSSRQPLYITLQEHLCHIPALPIPPDDGENGVMNAWLPPSTRLFECEGGINISDQRGTFKTFYETWFPGSDFDNDHCVLDIIVTGKTNSQHDTAWGGYKFLGRIRLSDGLIVLVREPLNPEITGATKVLFRGYVTSSHFVGRWRGVSNHNPAPFEAAFSFCKDD